MIPLTLITIIVIGIPLWYIIIEQPEPPNNSDDSK